MHTALKAISIVLVFAQVAWAALPPLRVKESDGNPNIPSVTELTVTNGSLTNNGSGKATLSTGAPTNADYLVGTANGSLSGEIVVGTSPGGELGGTWASPTIDAIHSGSAHHDSVTLAGTPDYLTLSGQQITRGTVDIGDDTNLAAGRSLTMSGDSVEADAELYTDTKCVWFEDPTADDDLKSIWVTNQAVTITGISCESDQTVNLDLQIDDGSPADVNGSDIACTSTWGEDTSLAGDTGMGANERLDLAVESVSGTPTWVSVCWEFTKDD